MKRLMHITKKISSKLVFFNENEPSDAYNMWSEEYDSQPDNLMLALDELIFTELISNIDFKDKVIADIGCGTGRHWEKMLLKQPANIIGFDVSKGMLEVIKRKFPEAEVHQLKTNKLEVLKNESCDIIVSTLALAHIKDIEDAFTEWNRVLKPNCHIIITDYHPETLAKGGNRTFRHKGKIVAVKNYVHTIKEIGAITNKLNLQIDYFIERKIDESVKHYYEKQNALKVYGKFYGTPIIYGAHLTRRNAAM
jgi:ubiquinone/menaquinone biosynthesis C-methylase UbiE